MGNVFHSWEQEFKTWFNKTFPLSHPEKGVMAIGLASCKSPYIDIKISSNGECQYFCSYFYH